MYKAFNFTYLVSMVIQAFWCLLFPIGVAFVLGWLAVNKLSLPSWVYVPLLAVATIIGLISMLRFLISAAAAMDRLEKERAERLAEERVKQKKNDINHAKNEEKSKEIDPQNQEKGDDK